MSIKINGLNYKPHGYRLVRDKDNIYYQKETLNDLRFLAVVDSTIKLERGPYGSEPLDIEIEYKLGDSGSWTPYNTLGTVINVPANEVIYFRNKKNTLSIDNDNYVGFAMTGEFRASGYVASMINYAELSESCFTALFANCEVLKSAPILPIPVNGLPERCYSSMFFNTGIVEPPLLHLEEVPGAGIGAYACGAMFSYCEQLYRAPKIKCSAINEYGCYQMFVNCIRMEVCEGVEVNNVIMENGCREMFAYCDRLSEIKSLVFPSVAIGEQGCSAMFAGCGFTDLSNINVDTQYLDSQALAYMFTSCYDLTKGFGQITTSDLSAEAVCTWMYADCTALTDMTEMPNVTKVGINSLDRMYGGCESLVNVYDLNATEGNADCYNSMFVACTALTRAPKINLTQLYDNACYRMFAACENLNISKDTGGTSFFKCPDTTGLSEPVAGMFTGCLGDDSDPVTGQQCFYN